MSGQPVAMSKLAWGNSSTIPIRSAITLESTSVRTIRAGNVTAAPPLPWSPRLSNDPQPADMQQSPHRPRQWRCAHQFRDSEPRFLFRSGGDRWQRVGKGGADLVRHYPRQESEGVGEFRGICRPDRGKCGSSLRIEQRQAEGRRDARNKVGVKPS